MHKTNSSLLSKLKQVLSASTVIGLDIFVLFETVQRARTTLK